MAEGEKTGWTLDEYGALSVFVPDTFAVWNERGEDGQVWQLLQAEIVISLCWGKYERVDGIFCRIFVENKLCFEFVNGESYVQKILKSCASKKSVMALAISRPFSFEVTLLLHVLMYLEICMQMKLLSTPPNYNSHVRAAYAA